MSLNAAEIDLILAELHLSGARVQAIVQTDFRNLYIEFYRHGGAWQLRICLEHPRVRLHRDSRAPRRKRSGQRFEDFLRARILGATVVTAEQVFHDRIVALRVQRGDEATLLYLQLWGAQANLIVCEPDGRILDAWFRKPSRGIESGAHFAPRPPERVRAMRPAREPRPRMDLNQTVEADYGELETRVLRERLLRDARRALQLRLTRARARFHELRAGSDGDDRAERWYRYGRLVTAAIHTIAPGADWVEVEDDDSGTLRIALDPRCSAAENAARYYERAKQAKRTAVELADKARNLATGIAALESQLATLEAGDDATLRTIIADAVASKSTKERAAPGLEFHSGPWTILVGRNAKENDSLLRRAVRGNDTWLHARDYAGAYVFVRGPRGRSIPLEVLLDAGNLAVFFSKARRAGVADLYYTQVKYLRRAKNAPLGLVLPTQEKNLRVELDVARLARMGVGAAPVA